MSHNIVSVNNQKSDSTGAINLSLEGLNDVSISNPSNGQVLGWSSPTVSAALNLVSPYDIAGSMWQSGGNWGGSGTYAVGDGAYWRHPSQTLNVNTNKISFPGGTWITQWTLQAGTYLMKWDIPFQLGSSSDSAVLRLKDVTNTQYLGPKIKIDSGRSSNHFMSIVSPSSATTYTWEFVSISGAVHIGNAQTYQSFQGAFIEI